MNSSDSRAQTLAQLGDAGVVAVLRAPDWRSCVEAAKALVEGGVLGIEVTYSTPDTERAIRACRDELPPHAVIGAGTVTTADQARAAVDAGATFLVSPGTTEQLAKAMTGTGAMCMMGALTPSEVIRARDLGADVVKLFPASLGGPSFVKALRGPFPDLPIVPTGGVTPENLPQWRAAGVVAVGTGSDLVPTAALASGDWAAVTERARVYASAWQGAGR